jgi:hypothetical protein
MIKTVEDKSVAATEGAGHVVEKMVDTTAQVLTTTVKDTASVGGDIGKAATGLVAGAIKGTKELAVGVEHAAAAIVGGALKATGEAGTAAVESVHNVLAKPVHTGTAVAGEPALAAAKK